MKHFFSIIGGMGTIATESYVRLINHRVKITKDQDYLNYILVNDAQIPDRTAYIMDHSKPNFFYDLKDDVLSQSKLNPDLSRLNNFNVGCWEGLWTFIWWISY